MQSIPDAPQRRLATATSTLQFIKSRRTDVSDRLAKLSTALGNFTLDAFKDVVSSLPPSGEVQLDVEDFSLSSGRLKISGRATSFEAVDKIKAALEKSGRFKNVTTGNVRKGVKDDIKFDLTMDMSGL